MFKNKYFWAKQCLVGHKKLGTLSPIALHGYEPVPMLREKLA